MSPLRALRSKNKIKMCRWVYQHRICSEISLATSDSTIVKPVHNNLSTIFCYGFILFCYLIPTFFFIFAILVRLCIAQWNIILQNWDISILVYPSPDFFHVNLVRYKMHHCSAYLKAEAWAASGFSCSDPNHRC
jgi:hypothetical protein